MPAHEPVRDRVERAAEDAGRRRHEPARPLQHLPRRAARERQQQDPLRRHALADEPREPRAQRRRLAGAGAGEDQQRPAGVRRGRPLLVIELVEPGALPDFRNDRHGPRTLRTAPDGSEIRPHGAADGCQRARGPADDRGVKTVRAFDALAAPARLRGGTGRGRLADRPQERRPSCSRPEAHARVRLGQGRRETSRGSEPEDDSGTEAPPGRADADAAPTRRQWPRSPSRSRTTPARTRRRPTTSARTARRRPSDKAASDEAKAEDRRNDDARRRRGLHRTPATLGPAGAAGRRRARRRRRRLRRGPRRVPGSDELRRAHRRTRRCRSAR